MEHPESIADSVQPAPGSPEAMGFDSRSDEQVRFLNRELTWLEFNRRVLYQAIDTRTPLLERVRFLSIFTSNLDEFYMKRVGGLYRQLAMGVQWRSPDGMSARALIGAIRQMVLPMLEAQSEAYDQIKGALVDQGISLLRWDDLSDEEQAIGNEYYRTDVFPVLTPLSVDPGHPFPFLSNLSVSLGVMLSPPGSDERHFARVKIPEVLPGWLELNAGSGKREMRFVRLREVIEQNLSDLFPGMSVLDMMPFRVTRNADIDRDEEDAEDLLEMIEKELRQRRFARSVRLELGPNPNPWMLNFLQRELALDEQAIYVMPGKLDYLNLNQIANIDRPDLKFHSWKPVTPKRLLQAEDDVFGMIRNGDLLVHHPYESFSGSVERFIRSAADDPHVLAIKMTVYRTGDDSPLIKTLIRAAEHGKQVVCLVELKARFDEERNIYWAQVLEKAGVHVVYGVVGLKTHTKTTLVVRRENQRVRCYAHIGTGNYHAGTAKLYTDLGLLTCDPSLTSDVVDLFHYLTGRSLQSSYNKLLVAPVTMRSRFISMIQREIENHQAGKPAYILAKMNSLEDPEICELLYQASQAGVDVDLIVRGFCSLRPGVPGLSDRIRVISIIGRFLEHSRIYYFRNAQEDKELGEYYIGSADWMYRNLNNRVEAITPIDNVVAKRRLWQILQIMLCDQRQAWDMQPDGSYQLRHPDPDTPEISAIGTHEALMRLTAQEEGGLPV